MQMEAVCVTDSFCLINSLMSLKELSDFLGGSLWLVLLEEQSWISTKGFDVMVYSEASLQLAMEHSFS